MAHVIAGGAIGRDLAMYGADVLNIWRPNDTELEAFAWDVQVRHALHHLGQLQGRSLDRLFKDADVFFANKRPGYLERHRLTADELCAMRPRLIHAKVVLHGETGPWSNHPGFDEIGAAVTGVFCIEGTPAVPKPLRYQGTTDQVVMSRTKESYRTIMAPRGSSKPQWLEP